jgi:DDE superfamily endonuclease.
VQVDSKNRKFLHFGDQCATYQQIAGTFLSCVLPQNCTSILQSLDQGIIGSFRHYYCKQLARKTVLRIGCKLLHNAPTLMKVNVEDALHFSVES